MTQRSEPISTPSPQQALVRVERLHHVYELDRGLFRRAHVHAVRGVSFSIARGETLGLVGESGCGKSTLGRMLLRLIDPTQGRLVFDGQDITSATERELRTIRRRMQMVFQDPYGSLNPRSTVRDIVAEPIIVFGLAKTRQAIDEQVAGALERVGLTPDMMRRYPRAFSGGQRQRIGIARALVSNPDLVVCDEPVSALDPSMQAQVLNLLGDLQDSSQASFLLISHDLRVVMHLSHRMAVMYKGALVEMGFVDDVSRKRSHPYTRELFDALPGARANRPLPLAANDAPALAGCAYFNRCAKAEKGKCDRETPSLSELVPGTRHRVACFFPG